MTNTEKRDPSPIYVTIVLNEGASARVNDNPLNSDLVVVLLEPAGLGDACIQGTLADVRAFIESALAGLNDVEEARQSDQGATP